MARVTSTPAGLIKSLESRKTLNVPVASKSKGNAWQPGDACPFESGVYCEDIIRRNDCLLVPDALSDPEWENNPDIEFGMKFYLGFPLLWSGGEPFGTICVLDCSSGNKAVECKELIAQFAKVVEGDLKLLVEVKERKRAEKELLEIKEEFEHRVANRTRRLEEVNTALKVLLREHEDTKKEIDASMLANINKLILPHHFQVS